MSEFVPKALSKLTRFPIIALPYQRHAEAIPRELLIDYDTGGIFIKDVNGDVKPLATSIHISSVYVKNDDKEILSLETLLTNIISSMLQIEEVNELSIFNIKKEAQFDLKSVILKNNLVQIYNFDQAQEDSIPMKINDRVSWVNRETLFAQAGLGVSAEGCFDILDLKIQTDILFEGVVISDALNTELIPVDNANGNYTATENNHVWTRTVGEQVFVATYDKETNQWSLSNPDITFKSFSVQTVNNVINELSLIENKKQRTDILENINLDVYLPASTGELAYSRIIWKVMTGDEPPVFNFKTISEGTPVEATNIIWQYPDEYRPEPNVNNFYSIETWDFGQNWYGKVERIGKSAKEITMTYLEDNYYNKAQIDSITSWDIQL